jgi:large conductance mechanosensitive channel
VKGFRDFITRGNVIDLAVAVVVGAAFTAIVTAVVHDVITPLIGAIWGTHEFESLNFKVHGSTFAIGDLINAIIYFLIVAAVVYYLVVKPVGALMARRQKTVEITTRDCPECLSTIPIAASRCMYCTAEVPPVTQTPAPPVPGSRLS